MKIIAICYLIVKDKYVRYTNFVQRGVQKKNLNTCNMHIKLVNKFQYTEKDGSVETKTIQHVITY